MKFFFQSSFCAIHFWFSPLWTLWIAFRFIYNPIIDVFDQNKHRTFTFGEIDLWSSSQIFIEGCNRAMLIWILFFFHLNRKLNLNLIRFTDSTNTITASNDLLTISANFDNEMLGSNDWALTIQTSVRQTLVFNQRREKKSFFFFECYLVFFHSSSWNFSIKHHYVTVRVS